MEIEYIRAHIEKKFAEATLDRFPFPHLLIEGFFPQEVFDQILEENPFKHNRGLDWIGPDQSQTLKTGTPYYARKQINFHSNNKFNLSPAGEELWEKIKRLFLDNDWFPKLVYDKYFEYFALRFGEAVEREDFFKLCRRQLFLQRHEPGYFIGPHTDVPTRVFTCIFSFADRPGFEEFGTEICVPNDPLERCWGNNHYSPEDFTVRKLAPYRPNGFFLFFKTRQSFHSVRAIDDSVPNQRFGMQFQFYEPQRGLFKDLSEPRLMTARHEKDKVPVEKPPRRRRKRKKALSKSAKLRRRVVSLRDKLKRLVGV